MFPLSSPISRKLEIDNNIKNKTKKLISSRVAIVSLFGGGAARF